MAKYEVIFYEKKNGDVPVQDFLMGLDTLSEQGDTRFCTTDLGFCRVTVAQRTSSTPRSSALQNPKSEAQNSFGPQVPYFGGWQGNGMRRTGRTPIDVNAASRQKTVLGASVPLFTEGKKMRAKLSAIISILQQYGNQLREPYSKYLDDGIFEIRGKIGSDISRV